MHCVDIFGSGVFILWMINICGVHIQVVVIFQEKSFGDVGKNIWHLLLCVSEKVVMII